MSYYGTVLDLPSPDLAIREGDVDPVTFTLRNADGTPVDLSGKTVKITLRPLRGVQTNLVYDSAIDVSRLAIVSPTAGTVRLLPAATSFTAISGPYHGYFSVLSGGVNPQTVPQDREIWIAILPAL